LPEVELKERKGMANNRKSILDYLESVSTVVVPARDEQFVVGKEFFVDTSDEAVVKIRWIGDIFTSLFHDKVEDPMGQHLLAFGRFRNNKTDDSVLKVPGQKVDTTLAAMHFFLKKQGRGEAGVFLNNGGSNIFYVRDVRGVLHGVGAAWEKGGWDIGINGPGPEMMSSRGIQMFYQTL
jgi:hypothetical protein